MRIRLLVKPALQVLDLDLEEYLCAVVPAEMSAMQLMEALKAQAVAARSFTVYARLHPRHGGTADLCSDTHCQAYRPLKRHPRTDEAVVATEGLVMTYRQQIVQAFFGGRCGGVTATTWPGGGKVNAAWVRAVPCLCALYNKDRYGPGVGMCQVGAYLMAQEGATWQDILLHYYGGIQIASLDEIFPGNN
jgi:peptidoglycan hydrolase-like amidase